MFGSTPPPFKKIKNKQLLIIDNYWGNLFQHTEGNNNIKIILIKRCYLIGVKLTALYKHDKNNINVCFRQTES